MKLSHITLKMVRIKDKYIPNAASNYTFLAVMTIDYSQVFSKERKYIEKEKRVIGHTIDHLEFFSDGNVFFERAILIMSF